MRKEVEMEIFPCGTANDNLLQWYHPRQGLQCTIAVPVRNSFH